MSPSPDSPSKIPVISAGISGVVLLLLGLSSCRNVQTESKWFGLVSERVDKGPDWLSIILLVGIGSAVAYLVARRMKKERPTASPDQVPAVEAKPPQMTAPPASPQSGDDLITSVTGHEPIALILTGRIDDRHTTGLSKIWERSFGDLPALSVVMVAATVVGTWIWNPLGIDSLEAHKARIGAAAVAGLCVGTLLRLVVGKKHLRIHDALVFGEDHVWVLVGCRLDRQTRAITCSRVDRHRKDQVTASVGQGFDAPLTGGRLVHVVVKAPGDWLNTGRYTLQQDAGHLDRQYFSRNVVTVAEAGAVLLGSKAPTQIAEIMNSNPPESAIPPSGPPLVGVRGWLLACCLWFSLVEPVLTLLSSPRNTELDQFGVARSGIVICLSVAAGVLMFFRKRIGVVLARAQCVVGVLFGVIAALNGAGALWHLIIPISWFVYLGRSKRVRQTIR